MPDHVMRHPWSTPGHPLKALQAAPNHVRWGIWVDGYLFSLHESNLEDLRIVIPNVAPAE